MAGQSLPLSSQNTVNRGRISANERNRDFSPTDSSVRMMLTLRPMNYQLVLQFDANSLVDFDRLISLETKLMETLDDTAVVDGHDSGLGKFNIFVHTNEPAATFTKAHQVVLDEAIPNEL